MTLGLLFELGCLGLVLQTFDALKLCKQIFFKQEVVSVLPSQRAYHVVLKNF